MFEFMLKEKTQDTKNAQLFDACSRGDALAVSGLIGEGADPNASRTDIPSMLVAAHAGHWNVVKLLLDHKADPDVWNAYGWCPLHEAAAAGHLEMIKELTDRGAYVECADNAGDTPLYVASKADKQTAALLLIELGGKGGRKNKSDDTPLHWACRNGNAELVRALCQCGGLATQANKDGETPSSCSKDKETLAALESSELRHEIDSATAKDPGIVSVGGDAAETKPAEPPAAPAKRKILKA